MATCFKKTAHGETPVKAEYGFSYIRHGKAKFFHVCKDHYDAEKEAAIKNPTILELRAGPICPVCDGTGFVRRFQHVAKGTCFRCEGRGHW
jgi:DnaJ-class molecular chaperone